MNKKAQKRLGNKKGLMALALAVVLLIGMFPLKAEAAPKVTWVPLGNGVHQLEGTDVKVEISPGYVHVTGTGAIPDYDYWDLKSRPWSTNECEAVAIDDTITSVGAYAFYELPKLKYITLSSKTFITDYTSFYKNDQRPIFRIQGSEVRTEMFGTVPYTSRNSLTALAQSGYAGAAYVFDNNELASNFQATANPTIRNVFSAADGNAPWNDLVTNGNGNVYTQVCRISAPTPMNAYTVTGTKKAQGKACYQAFATVMGDYTFGSTFNIVVTTNDVAKHIVGTTPAAYQYALNIPQEYQKPGRSFKLLAIGKGKLLIYDDLDAAGNTITFSTDYPTTSYALVYKDA